MVGRDTGQGNGAVCTEEGNQLCEALAEGTVKVWGHRTATGTNSIPVTHSPIKIQIYRSFIAHEGYDSEP